MLATLARSIESASPSAKPVGDDALLQLHFFHGAVLAQALDIVDRTGVVRVSCPAGRAYYTVSEHKHRQHLCLPDSKFCSCTHFLTNVVSKEQLQCKHLVAVSVAEMTATVIQREVSDTDFADLLC